MSCVPTIDRISENNPEILDIPIGNLKNHFPTIDLQGASCWFSGGCISIIKQHIDISGIFLGHVCACV